MLSFWLTTPGAYFSVDFEFLLHNNTFSYLLTRLTQIFCYLQSRASWLMTFPISILSANFFTGIVSHFLDEDSWFGLSECRLSCPRLKFLRQQVVFSDAQKQDQDSFGLGKWGWLWADILVGPVTPCTWRAAGAPYRHQSGSWNSGSQGQKKEKIALLTLLKKPELSLTVGSAWRPPPHILFLSSPGDVGSTLAASTAFSPIPLPLLSALSGFIILASFFNGSTLFFYIFKAISSFL